MPRPVMITPETPFTDLADQLGQPILVACVGGWGDWIGQAPRLNINNRNLLEWLTSQPDVGTIVLAHSAQQVLLHYYAAEDVIGRREREGAPLVPPEMAPDFGDCSVHQPEVFESEEDLMRAIAQQSGYASLDILRSMARPRWQPDEA